MTNTPSIEQLLERIEKLEAQVARDAGDRAPDCEQQHEQHATRRGVLRLAGVAAMSGLAAVVVADPAAAADPNDVVLNLATNAGTAPTGIAMAAASTNYGLGCYETGGGTPDAQLGRPAVFGHATGTAFTTGVAGHTSLTGAAGMVGLDTSGGLGGSGVLGRSTDGIGVRGASTNYIGVNGHSAADAPGVYGVSGLGPGLAGRGGGGAIYLGSTVATAPPDRGTVFEMNTLENDSAGNVWFCYESGTPGKWLKLAGPATAGAFHAITPTRVYDSRSTAPSPGPLAAGASRTISVADGRDSNGTVITPNLVPAGATAVAANVTVTGTTGAFGFLTVNPGGVTDVNASTINWFGAGQNLANGVTLTLNTARELTVVCGTGGGSTHFIIDIAGYYR